jgi:hypothetical protein
VSQTTQLYARTARGGRHNHVEIVPEDVSLPRDFSRYVRLAESAERGVDYLAVCREVRQESGRLGSEVLILHGVDVTVLERNKQLERVQSRLRELQDKLDHLVQEIDWDKNGPAPVPRVELTQWLHELEQAAGGTLPSARAAKSRNGMTTAREKMVWGTIAMVILVAAGGIALHSTQPEPFSWIRGKKSKDKERREDKAEKGDLKKEEARTEEEAKARITEQCEELAVKWQGDFNAKQVKEVIRVALARTNNTQPKDSDIEKTLKSILKGWNESKPQQKYSLTGYQKKDSTYIRDLLLVSVTKQEIVEARMQLDKFASELKNLQEQAKSLSMLKPPDKGQLSILRCKALLALVAKFSQDPEIGKLGSGAADETDGAFSKTPLLDGHHLQTAILRDRVSIWLGTFDGDRSLAAEPEKLSKARDSLIDGNGGHEQAITCFTNSLEELQRILKDWPMRK